MIVQRMQGVHGVMSEDVQPNDLHLVNMNYTVVALDAAAAVRALGDIGAVVAAGPLAAEHATNVGVSLNGFLIRGGSPLAHTML